MEDFVVVNGKKFRKGYTTGATAAAAAKAAVHMLIFKTPLEIVTIDTPAGIKLTLQVANINITNESVRCSVVKDGGDDPDVTSGLHIFAKVKWKETKGIEITAGNGIGIVTLKGLKIEVGKPAINPVPLKMIEHEVNSILQGEKGVQVELSVPGGDEVALKTYNPRLGIIGGISILGTTGIVNPMSEEAWKESLALELGILVARGQKHAVFIFGNYGESFVINEMGIKQEAIIKISNFLGFMLDKAVENGLESVLLVGHLGKLIKVAAGIFHTHSRVADARMETMTAYAALEGANSKIASEIYNCKTTEAAAEIINENGFEKVYSRIVSNAARRCSEFCFNKLLVGVVLFHEDNTLLAIDDNARKILHEGGSQYGQ